jgi:hypothetical protein
MFYFWQEAEPGVSICHGAPCQYQVAPIHQDGKLNKLSAFLAYRLYFV